MLDKAEMTAEQISNLLQKALASDISNDVSNYLTKLAVLEIETVIKSRVAAIVKTIMATSTAISRDPSSGELVINIVFRQK